MSTARNLAPTSAVLLSWGKICMLHPNEWVCLLDIAHDADGSIHPRAS